MDGKDRQIIAAMQEDLPLVAEPYQAIADKLGITVAELLVCLKKYQASGKIRKVGAVIRHRRAGFMANALCAWKIPEDKKAEIGSLFSKEAAVTHCYERITQPDWQYNLYTMVHARTREECLVIATKLAQAAGCLLYTSPSPRDT